MRFPTVTEDTRIYRMRGRTACAPAMTVEYDVRKIQSNIAGGRMPEALLTGLVDFGEWCGTTDQRIQGLNRNWDSPIFNGNRF